MPSNGTESGQVGTRQRARAQLSCTSCRQGKLKCNRSKPCDQCVKRCRETACNYLAPPSRKKPDHSMKDRIKHLESLVVDLINNELPDGEPTRYPLPSLDSSNGSRIDQSPNSSGKSSTSPSAGVSGSDSEDIREPSGAFGQMSIGKSTARYVGNAHWEAILGNIAEVKAELDGDGSDEGAEAENDSEAFMDHDGPSPAEVLLAAGSPTQTKEVLLARLPERRMVNTLISHYFNFKNPALNLVHTPTFMEEYQQFWQNPSAVSCAWLSLLLGILSISCVFSRDTELWQIYPDRASRADREYLRLQKMTGAALLLADWTRPGPYILESLLMYHLGVYYQGPKIQDKVWLAFAGIIRLSLRMGLHRDPDHVPNMSVYEGEMRRRLWNVMWQLDVLLSFHIGLPSMIRQIHSDTRPPHNILDSDFSKATRVLPPERPPNDLTPASYSIAKGRLAVVFAQAADASHAVTPPSHAEIAALNARIEDAHQKIPLPLQARPLEQCIADSADLIMIRCNLELLYQKTRCILHRRYLGESWRDNRFVESRRLCVEAAMEILRLHAAVHDASQPSGQLYTVRWYMSTLSSHDFLLGAMIVSLALDQLSNHGEAETRNEKCAPFSEMRQALKTSYNIWKEPQYSNPATHKAVKALTIMLRRLDSPPMNKTVRESPTDVAPRISGNSTSATNGFAPLPDFNLSAFDEQFSMQMHDPMLDLQSTFEPINTMFDMPADMDWRTWDNFVQDGSNIHVPYGVASPDVSNNLLGDSLV